MDKKYMVLFNSVDFQRRILDCILTDEIDKFFNATIFADSSDAANCKQAMIHGMIIASMMTCDIDKSYIIPVEQKKVDI